MFANLDEGEIGFISGVFEEGDFVASFSAKVSKHVFQLIDFFGELFLEGCDILCCTSVYFFQLGQILLVCASQRRYLQI